MLETIKTATEDVFKNTFALQVNESEQKPKTGYLSSIVFKTGNLDSISYTFEKALLIDLVEILMLDTDEASLQDLSCELANLITGKAKVILEDQSVYCQMGTPSFLGEKEPPKGHTDISFSYNNKYFSINLGAN